MFNFRSLLSPETTARLDETSRMISHYYALPDRFLARQLILLARQARAEIATRDSYINDPAHGTYNTSLLWSLVPELAHRLGETRCQENERFDQDLRRETNDQLRLTVGIYLNHSELRRYSDRRGATPTACEILSHEIANGNPIAFAIDRLSPPTDTSNDWVTSHIKEVGNYRFGHGHPHRAWSPVFQEYRQSA